MCKDNTITTSWSSIGAFIAGLLLVGGIIATSLGANLTWGEIMFIPFVVTFFLNKKSRYSFTDSGFTVRCLFFQRTVSTEEIQQINAFETKSGTWIVIKLEGAPEIDSGANRRAIVIYCLQHRRKSFLIPLQWGECDKALKMLRGYYPKKNILLF